MQYLRLTEQLPGDASGIHGYIWCGYAEFPIRPVSSPALHGSYNQVLSAALHVPSLPRSLGSRERSTMEPPAKGPFVAAVSTRLAGLSGVVAIGDVCDGLVID